MCHITQPLGRITRYHSSEPPNLIVRFQDPLRFRSCRDPMNQSGTGFGRRARTGDSGPSILRRNGRKHVPAWREIILSGETPDILPAHAISLPAGMGFHPSLQGVKGRFGLCQDPPCGIRSRRCFRGFRLPAGRYDPFLAGWVSLTTQPWEWVKWLIRFILFIFKYLRPHDSGNSKGSAWQESCFLFY
jgi:hypothetical protein